MYNAELSYEIAMSVSCPPRQCFSTAVRVLRNRSQGDVRHAVDLSGAHYIEGCAKIALLFFQHGWLELLDGTILDPTRITVELETDHCREYTYYPMHRYTKEELKGYRLSAFPLDKLGLAKQVMKLYGLDREASDL